MSFDLNTPQLLELPEIRDERGVNVLGFVESGLNCPFPIERVYYIYDFPTGTDRGQRDFSDAQADSGVFLLPPAIGIHSQLPNINVFLRDLN